MNRPNTGTDQYKAPTPYLNKRDLFPSGTSGLWEAVTEFHRRFGHPVKSRPFLPVAHEAVCREAHAAAIDVRRHVREAREAAGSGGGERALRMALLGEEYAEYLEAESHSNIEQIADALGDILVIVYGTALAYGIPLDDVFAEIHRANMSKLGEDGLPITDETGKVKKGPHYTPPDVAGVLRDGGLQ